MAILSSVLGKLFSNDKEVITTSGSFVDNASAVTAGLTVGDLYLNTTENTIKAVV